MVCCKLVMLFSVMNLITQVLLTACRISRCKVVVYKHNDMADLQRLLETEIVTGQRFIVTDGVFSMDGDIADLPSLAVLKKQFNACLIVDDAHGVGVIGNDRQRNGVSLRFNGCNRSAGRNIEQGVGSRRRLCSW